MMAQFDQEIMLGRGGIGERWALVLFWDDSMTVRSEPRRKCGLSWHVIAAGSRDACEAAKRLMQLP
jgi:hypothetical protein